MKNNIKFKKARFITEETTLSKALENGKIITEEFSLLEVLKWKDGNWRNVFFYDDDLVKVRIYFLNSYKEVHFTTNKFNINLTIRTSELTPKKIIELIETTMEWTERQNEK